MLFFSRSCRLSANSYPRARRIIAQRDRILHRSSLSLHRLGVRRALPRMMPEKSIAVGGCCCLLVEQYTDSMVSNTFTKQCNLYCDYTTRPRPRMGLVRLASIPFAPTR